MLLQPRQLKKSLFKYFFGSKTSLLTPTFKGNLHCTYNLKKAQNWLIIPRHTLLCIMADDVIVVMVTAAKCRHTMAF